LNKEIRKQLSFSDADFALMAREAEREVHWYQEMLAYKGQGPGDDWAREEAQEELDRVEKKLAFYASQAREASVDP
jgi:hypothetical protein